MIYNIIYNFPRLTKVVHLISRSEAFFFFGANGCVFRNMSVKKFPAVFYVSNKVNFQNGFTDKMVRF